MVDRALAEQTGAALDLLADDTGEGSGGAGGDVIGGAENGDCRNVERSGDVHGAGVICKEGDAGGGDGDKLFELRFAREIMDSDAFGGDGDFDIFAEFAFSLGAKYGHAGGGLAGQIDGGGGEAFGEPALGGTKGCAGADAKPVAAELALAKDRVALFDKVFETGDSNGVHGGEAVDEAGATKEFEIVEALMIRDFARFWRPNWVREEQAAAIAGVADAGGDASGPDEGGGFEGVGKEDGAIETLCVQFPGEAPFTGDVFGAAGEGVGDNVVDQGVVIETGDPRAGKECDAGIGKTASDLRQRGDAHDGVTDPVGGAHEDTAKLHAL